MVIVSIRLSSSSILGYWNILWSNYKVKFISRSNHSFNKLTVAHTIHIPKMKMISYMLLSLLKFKVLLSSIQKSAGQYIAIGHWVIYKIPFYTTRETRMQALQYKTIHNTILCNQWLNRIKIIESETCIFLIKKLYIYAKKNIYLQC